MEKLKVIDLFSGLGGFSLGLEETGKFETVAFCENDQDCIDHLQEKFPTVPVFIDVKQINIHRQKDSESRTMYEHIDKFHSVEFSNVDMVVGGFPCTDISTANTNGKGLDGERSGLWFEFKRIIGEVRPKYAIIENVANLRSRGLGEVLKNLWKIGYNAEWQILSGYSMGSPHQRERIYIVAWRKDLPYCNPFRLWRPTSVEEKDYERVGKSNGWSKRSSCLPDVYREVGGVESSVLRATAWLSKEFHINEKRSGKAEEVRKEVVKTARAIEKIRSKRVQLIGNSLMPQAPMMIGTAIAEFEETRL